MIIERTMKVTPEEFYEYMLDDVQEQINNTFGKEIPREKLKPGYSHKTVMTNQKTGARRTLKYTITKMIPNRQFETTFNSAEYRTKMSYKLEQVPGGTKVTLEQNTHFNDPTQEPKGLGGNIDQFFLKKKLQRSMKKVEKDIIARR